ncbi:MAG: FAD-binding protein [Actinomycetota bacterium]
MTAESATPTLATDDPVLLAFADEVGAEGPVSVEGGRTRWSLGGELTPGTRTLPAPAGIVAYTPDEMTVTVRAGTPVAELHAALAERGQRTALPERGGTVGGAVVVGESDVRALGLGPVRNAVLQVRYVSADGRIVSGGGPTVKNVSGFDLPRLLVGSLGTLGLIAEVILRTNPIPPVSRWLAAGDAEPQAVVDRLLDPAAVLWDGTTTWVLLEGHEPDVDAEQLALAAVGSFAAVDPVSPTGLPVDLPPNRWSLAPADVVTLDSGATGAFVAAVGFGLVLAERPQPPRPAAPAVVAVADRLKQNFDPTGRLNPGRHPANR